MVRRKRVMAKAPPEMRAWLERPQPIEMRTVGGHTEASRPAAREPIQQMWFRAKDAIGADPHMHQVIMAYASDMSLLGTSLRPHALDFNRGGLQTASLDHAMWFHRPTDFNQWHLYHQESPSASGGRGFNLGYIYRASDGVLVASCAQEGLMRMRKPKS
jgi:acyl-CoA thioesterase-2